MTRRAIILFCLGLGAGVALAADSGRLIRASDFRTGPYGDAAQIGVLRADTEVEVLQRSGGWYEIRLPDGRQGWVRMASVRFQETPREEASGGWLFSWFGTGRETGRWTTATTGIRGLDEEDIQAAQPDPAAVDSLDRFAVDAETARRFAAELQLRPQPVKPLPEPRD